MSLRIAFDLDGVLADLASAYRAVEERLFGSDATGGEGQVSGAPGAAADPLQAEPSENAAGAGARRAAELVAQTERRDRVWRTMLSTEDFWTTLAPIEDRAVSRLAALAVRYGWEVFFVTQRPPAVGQTVQRQTQRWLVAQGFDLPSVLVVRGSRGAVASALDLDYLVDDTPQHCVDVRAESSATPILIIREPDPRQEGAAARLGITVVRSVDEALDVLERAQAAAPAGSPP